MTVDAFKQGLAKRYDNCKAEVLSDIGDYLKRFTEDDLEKIWDHFKSKYLLVGPPKQGHIEALVEDLGLRFKGSSETAKYEIFCMLCEKHYPVEAPGCPRCGPGERGSYAMVRAGYTPRGDVIDSYRNAYHPGPHPTLSTTNAGNLGAPPEKYVLPPRAQPAAPKPAQKVAVAMEEDPEVPYWAR